MSDDNRVLGLIPARFDSTRFPGKPLAVISGKTLIQRTYENALKCEALNDLAVATDNKKIFDHVMEFGGKAVMTSPDCPTGTERLAEAISGNEQYAGYGIIVNIQGDEPALKATVIEKIIDKLREDKDAVMSTAVVRIKTRDEAVSTSVNKCVMDGNENALYFSRGLIPCGHKREWNPGVAYYKHLGIYGYRRDFLLHYAELSSTPLQLAEDLEKLKVLQHVFRIKVAIVESDSIGVDRPEDIKKIERIL